jgi:ABC-type transport system involved in cytochrome c biogenesis ATPase subunit
LDGCAGNSSQRFFHASRRHLEYGQLSTTIRQQREIASSCIRHSSLWALGMANMEVEEVETLAAIVHRIVSSPYAVSLKVGLVFSTAVALERMHFPNETYKLG